MSTVALCSAPAGPQALGLLVIAGGTATFGIGAFHDVGTAYRAAHARNLEVTVAPLRTPSGTVPGLVLQTAF